MDPTLHPPPNTGPMPSSVLGSRLHVCCPPMSGDSCPTPNSPIPTRAPGLGPLLGFDIYALPSPPSHCLLSEAHNLSCTCFSCLLFAHTIPNQVCLSILLPTPPASQILLNIRSGLFQEALPDFSSSYLLFLGLTAYLLRHSNFTLILKRRDHVTYSLCGHRVQAKRAMSSGRMGSLNDSEGSTQRVPMDGVHTAV